MILRQSTITEKPLQASKWLDSAALVSPRELADLFTFLEESSPFSLYSCGVVCSKNHGAMPKEELLKAYETYVRQLIDGQIPDPAVYRKMFSPAMTVTTEALFSVPVINDRQIIRVSKPVIQLQAHNIDYSPVDKKFHSMVFGLDSIAWGIQFSYPQLYLDNKTGEVETIRKSEAFPNTAIFQQLQKWMRQHTIPTPFIAEGNLVNVPMRLGKECLSWINNHPQLIQNHISVKPKT